MCFVSRAIAPRLPWLESHLGHWYWDVPSYAHRYVKHREFVDKSGEEEKPLWEQRSAGQTLQAKEERKEAKPHRAPPRERAFSIGTNRPHPSGFTKLLNCPEFAFQTDHILYARRR